MKDRQTSEIADKETRRTQKRKALASTMCSYAGAYAAVFIAGVRRSARRKARLAVSE